MESSLTAEEFYEKRDIRTAAMADLAGLSRATIRISIDQGEAETMSGQIALLLLVNISARWCRCISLDVPDVPVHNAISALGSGMLLDYALKMAQSADPFGCFSASDDQSVPHIAIHVGASPPSDELCVMGRGWVAELNNCNALGVPYADTPNPLGPALAACLGACYTFRCALNHVDLCRQARLSLWNLRDGLSATDGPKLDDLNLGRVLLIGAGAIGASIAYLLPLLPVRFSDLVLLDQDIVSYSNLNRIPLFFADDAGLSKVLLTRDYLKAAGIESRPICQWFDEAIGDGLRLQEFDLVIPTANEQGVRGALPSNCPPLMIHGSTGPNWDAFSGRHIPLRDDCLACRYPERGAAPVCATGDLAPTDPSGKQMQLTGALPFLSLAGATLALAEIAKLGLADRAVSRNTVILSFRSSTMRFMALDRTPDPACGRCPSPEAWLALNGRSRFVSLSPRVG